MILLNRRHSERKYFNLLHSVHQTFLHPLQNILHLWFAVPNTAHHYLNTLNLVNSLKKKHLHVENCLLKQHFKDSKWKVSIKRSILNVWMFNQSPHGRKKKNVFNVKTKSSSQLALVVKLWPQTCKRRRKAASRGTARTVKLELNKTDMSWVRSERLSTYGWRNFHFQVGCWN